jgi:hypothetical protein
MPASQGSSSQKAAADPQIQEAVRSFFRSIRHDPTAVASANRFWTIIRRLLEAQADEVRSLQLELGNLQASQPIEPPSRPGTSLSILSLRRAVDDEMEVLANERRALEQEASTVVEEIGQLSPEWVGILLDRRRVPHLGGELGCWVSSTVPAHSTGYVKVNLRNTRHPQRPGEYFTTQPFQHQLGAVAKGQGPLLRLTCPPERTHQVIPSAL